MEGVNAFSKMNPKCLAPIYLLISLSTTGPFPLFYVFEDWVYSVSDSLPEAYSLSLNGYHANTEPIGIHTK